MKKAFLFLLASATAASAQFKNSAGTPFPYKQSLAPTDVFIVGTPGVSNYNFTWLSLTNSAVKAALSAQVFDVRNYGANGDDDLPGNDHYALQRAIDEAGAAGGGVVYLPRGTFFLTRTSYYPSFVSENFSSLIVITGNNITIQGAGRDATKIKFWPGNFGVFNAFAAGGNNWHGADNFVMRDLTVESSTNIYYVFDMFQFYANAGFSIFERCNFLNHRAYYNGTQSVCDDILDFGNEPAANMLIVRDCLFSNITSSAVHSLATNGTYIENCIFADCDTADIEGGLFEQQRGVTVIQGCAFNGNFTRILSGYGSSDPVIFRDCRFSLSSSAVTNKSHIFPSSPLVMERCTFYIDGWTQLYTNAWTNSAWIYITNGEPNHGYRVTLRDNRFLTKPAIRFEESRDVVEIEGNYFGNGVSPSPSLKPVVINGGGRRVVFANNFLDTMSGSLDFIGYTKPFTNLIIVDNYSIGGHIKVFVADSNCVPYGVKITGNRFQNAYLELAGVGPTYCLVSDNTIVGNSFYVGGASNIVTRNIFDQIGPSSSGGTSPTNNLLAYNILGDFQFASTKNNQFGFMNITRTNYDFKFKNDVKPAVFSTNVLLVAGTNRISTQFASSTNTISLSYQALDGTIASVAVANLSEGSYIDVKSSNAADTNRVHVVIFRQ